MRSMHHMQSLSACFYYGDAMQRHSAQYLKSAASKIACRFDSGSGHHQINDLRVIAGTSVGTLGAYCVGKSCQSSPIAPTYFAGGFARFFAAALRVISRTASIPMYSASDQPESVQRIARVFIVSPDALFGLRPWPRSLGGRLSSVMCK